MKQHWVAVVSDLVILRFIKGHSQICNAIYNTTVAFSFSTRYTTTEEETNGLSESSEVLMTESWKGTSGFASRDVGMVTSTTDAPSPHSWDTVTAKVLRLAAPLRIRVSCDRQSCLDGWRSS